MVINVKYMTADEVALSLETARLEQQYERVLRQAERIYEEERSRVLRVQLLLLEDENDVLRDQIQDDEVELQILENTNEDLKDTLATAEAEFQAVQVELKAHSRDLERYKAEINALNATNADSTKLLSEKLALSRELSIVKPELEHLKSQAAVQQNFLADKLALERELSSIRVELETEKRAVQRMKNQEKTNSGEVVMIDEIESLKKDVAREKKVAQKQEREHMKKAAEWDTQKESLEDKLEAFRNKLRTTKEQLKEAQDELEKAQTAKFARASEAAKARMNGENPKKRNVARFDPDMTIGTPGNGGPAAKKQRVSVVAGDKSTFSITPFLNKTMSILPESPSEEQIDEEVGEPAITKTKDTEVATHKKADDVLITKKPSNTKKTEPKKASAKAKESQPLKESTNPKANRVVKQPALPKVTEEEVDEEEIDKQVEITKTTTEKSEIEPVKPKNKFLSANRPTLFDDDEDTAPKRASKKLDLSGLRGSGGGIMNLKKINVGGKNKVLAEFSPLKKDRRIAV